MNDGYDTEFDGGRVVGQAIAVIGRNFPLFLGLTVLLAGVPAVAMPLLLTEGGAADQVPPNLAGIYANAGILILVSTCCSYVLTAALSYATATDLNDERPTFGKALATGLRSLLPLLLLALVSVIGIYGGMLLLIVPGLILLVAWSVAAPALVCERLGVFASLGRSQQLTKGWRWRIFFLFLVGGFISLIPAGLSPLVTGAFGGTPTGLEPLALVGLALRVLLQSLSSMMLVTLSAATYFELRTIKDGATTDSLASIFA